MNIQVVYFNAGGGHRAAARALQAACAQQGRPWTMAAVNLVDMIDPAGAFQRTFGMAPEDWYNHRLARGWTLGLGQELKLLQGLVRMAHGPLCQRLVSHWHRAARPDLVVSVIPNFNRALGASLALAWPGVPFMTVMTDMADHPPNFWREDDIDQHLVCGTAHAWTQARRAGHPPHRLHRISGMPVHPDFHAARPIDRAAHRRALGLPAPHPAVPVGVVMFGGAGSMAMARIARRLPDTALILLCGRHQRLAERLRGQSAPAPRVVVGDTPHVWRYLALGDFFIGKPGPGSMTEALLAGLPVITTRNAFTMPQERYKTHWLEQQGLGLVLGSFRQIDRAVAQLHGDLASFRTRVGGQSNRAVYDVLDVIGNVGQLAASPADLQMAA